MVYMKASLLLSLSFSDFLPLSSVFTHYYQHCGSLEDDLLSLGDVPANYNAYTTFKPVYSHFALM